MKMGTMAKPDCIITSDRKKKKIIIKMESTLKTNFPVIWKRSLKKLQLMAEKFRHSATLRFIGSIPGMRWEEKYNNKKIGRWEISGGMNHEQYHLYLGL